MMLVGRATALGTRRFAERTGGRVAPRHYEEGLGGLTLSSIGFGTYRGDADAEADDRCLRATAEQSLRNLGVQTVDVYYLHDPATEVAELDRAEFNRRLRVAFEELGKLAAEGEIGVCGTATWNGYRVHPEDPDHLALE